MHFVFSFYSYKQPTQQTARGELCPRLHSEQAITSEFKVHNLDKALILVTIAL